MFNVESGICDECSVDNCAYCAETVNTCTECMGGYDLSEGTCTANQTVGHMPCGQGYYRDAEKKCVACDDGCASCTADSC